MPAPRARARAPQPALEQRGWGLDGPSGIRARRSAHGTFRTLLEGLFLEKGANDYRI